MKERQKGNNILYRVFISPIAYSIKNWKQDWGNLLIITFPVLLAIPFFQDIIKLHWTIPVFVIIFTISGWIQTNYHKESVLTIQDSYDRLLEIKSHLTYTMESIPIEIIRHLYNHWNFGYDDRVTIYRYAKNDFVPVGRYSKNVELNARGRNSYPKDEGFISKAWLNGEFHIDNLPDYSQDPERYIDAVIKANKIKKGTVREMSMQSRSFYCKNLTNQYDTPIAVIVIESLSKQLPIEHEKLSQDLDETFGKILVSAIESNLPIGKGD